MDESYHMRNLCFWIIWKAHLKPDGATSVHVEGVEQEVCVHGCIWKHRMNNSLWGVKGTNSITVQLCWFYNFKHIFLLTSFISKQSKSVN